MKTFTKRITKCLSAVLAVGMLAANCFAASASGSGSANSGKKSNLETVEIDVSQAKVVEKLGQSIKVDFEAFDTTRLTDKSEIIFEIERQDDIETTSEEDDIKYPCSLVIQSWEHVGKKQEGIKNTDQYDNVWTVIYPDKFEDDVATFTYQQIVDAYGSSDFNLLDAIYCQSTNRCKILCKSFKITNVKPESEGTHKYDSTQKTKTSPVVIAIAVIVAIAVQDVIIIMIMNKKASKALDLRTGSYVDLKGKK